jgi:hypothetical protein
VVAVGRPQGEATSTTGVAMSAAQPELRAPPVDRGAAFARLSNDRRTRVLCDQLTEHLTTNVGVSPYLQ